MTPRLPLGRLLARSQQLLLEEAAKKELVDGDLKGAIEIYQRILKMEGTPRSITARTLLRLGQCYEKLGTTEGQALDVVFNRTGRVEAIRNPEVIGSGNPFNVSIPQILRDYFPAFPVEPLGRGESWNESRRLTIPFQGLDLQVNLAITYTLDDILPADDGRLAVISAVYRVAVSGSKDLADTQGVFEGQGAGAGSLQVHVDKGWFSEYRVDFKTDASFVMKKGADRLAEFPFSFSAFAEVALLYAQAPDPVIR